MSPNDEQWNQTLIDPPAEKASSSDEDEQFRQAVQLSLQLSTPKQDQVSLPSTATSQSEANQSAFLTDRAQMEKDRLARLKRVRPELAFQEQSTSKRHCVSQPSASTSNDTTSAHSEPSANNIFWDGVVRQTCSAVANPRKDGQPVFTISDILGDKTDLACAILSTFALDMLWTYALFDPDVPVILVHASAEGTQASLKQIAPNWIRASPAMYGRYGCMHIKFMLLFYKTGRLRVVVSTANLVDYDYRLIENTVWLQDVPLLSNPTRPIPESKKRSPLEEDFQTSFERVLEALHVPAALSVLLKDHPNLPFQTVRDLKWKWDWSKVKASLVPTMKGKHEGWEKVVKQGHPRLMAVIRRIGMEVGNSKGNSTKKELHLEYQGSSIGQYSTQWINEFYHSASGRSAEDWLDEPKSRRSKLPYPPVKIVYPSLKTVQCSVLGEGGAGTMFCKRKYWSAANFPRASFYDSKSKAGGTLMHSKIIIATIVDSGQTTIDLTNSDDETEETFQGWAYIGSANFTPSAWGTISGSAFNPTLNITNYELGVVIPLTSKTEADRIACFQRPPLKYAASDIPWIQDESTVLQASNS